MYLVPESYTLKMLNGKFYVYFATIKKVKKKKKKKLVSISILQKADCQHLHTFNIYYTAFTFPIYTCMMKEFHFLTQNILVKFAFIFYSAKVLCIKLLNY